MMESRIPICTILRRRFPSLPYFSLVSDKKLEICGSVCFGYFLTVLLKTIYLERKQLKNIIES